MQLVIQLFEKITPVLTLLIGFYISTFSAKKQLRQEFTRDMAKKKLELYSNMLGKLNRIATSDGNRHELQASVRNILIDNYILIDADIRDSIICVLNSGEVSASDVEKINDTLRLRLKVDEASSFLL